MKRFLVVGSQRSGTTLVHQILRAHPAVSSLKDEVKATVLFGAGISAYTFGQDTEEEYRRGFDLAFDMLARVNATPETRAGGVKCALSTLEEAELLVDCCRTHLPGLAVIVTVRQDLLAQFGSLLRARATGRWHSFTVAEDDRTTTVTIPPEDYREYFLQHTAIAEAIRSLTASHDCLEVHFERNLPDVASLTARLHRFLGLELCPPEEVLPRKVAPPPDEFITNYHDLKKLETDFLAEYAAWRDQRPPVDQGMPAVDASDGVVPRSPMLRAWHFLESRQPEEALAAARRTGEDDQITTRPSVSVRISSPCSESSMRRPMRSTRPLPVTPTTRPRTHDWRSCGFIRRGLTKRRRRCVERRRCWRMMERGGMRCHGGSGESPTIWRVPPVVRTSSRWERRRAISTGCGSGSKTRSPSTTRRVSSRRPGSAPGTSTGRNGKRRRRLRSKPTAPRPTGGWRRSGFIRAGSTNRWRRRPAR